MVPSASVLDCRREERVQKAFSVDHHEHGDAGVSAVLDPLSGVRCDYVALRTCKTGRGMDPLEDRTRDISLCSPVASLLSRLVPPLLAVSFCGLLRGLQSSFVSRLRHMTSFVPISFVLLLLLPTGPAQVM